MPQIEFEETLPYSAKDLYDTVMDIEHYPEIFDFIESVQVKNKGDGTISADLVVKTPLMNFGYSCDITCTPPELITINATKGPFKAMNGVWRFTAMPDGQTKIHYQMSYELGFGLLNMAAKKFLESQVEETRCYLLDYVKRTLAPLNAKHPSPSPNL